MTHAHTRKDPVYVNTPAHPNQPRGHVHAYALYSVVPVRRGTTLFAVGDPGEHDEVTLRGLAMSHAIPDGWFRVHEVWVPLN